MYKNPIKYAIETMMPRRGIKNPTHLAEASGVAQSIISRIMSGKHSTMEIQNAQKIATALGISIDQLTGIVPLPPLEANDETELYETFGEYTRQLLYFFNGMTIDHKDALLMMAQSFYKNDMPNDPISNPYPNKPKSAAEDVEQ